MVGVPGAGNSRRAGEARAWGMWLLLALLLRGPFTMLQGLGIPTDGDGQVCQSFAQRRTCC